MVAPVREAAEAHQKTSGTDAEIRPVAPAIETALTENYRDFLRYLVRRVGDVATAEDVLHSFCMRVLRSKTVLRNENSAVAWLYTVLRSVLTDHYRKEAVRQRRNVRYASDQIALAEDPAETEPADDICGCIRSLVPALRPGYAEVLQQVDLSGGAREHVATGLGISPANLRVRLHRARLAAGKALLKHCGGCCKTGFRECFCPRAGRETPHEDAVRWPLAEGEAGAFEHI